MVIPINTDIWSPFENEITLRQGNNIDSSPLPDSDLNNVPSGSFRNSFIFVLVTLNTAIIVRFLLLYFRKVLYRGRHRNNNNNESEGGGRGPRQPTSTFRNPRVINGENEENPDLIVLEIPTSSSYSEEQQSKQVIVFSSSSDQGLLKSFEPTEEHDEMVCALCLESLPTRKLAAFPCKHALHEDCYKSWIVKSKRLDCPLCAQDYSNYQEENNSQVSPSS